MLRNGRNHYETGTKPAMPQLTEPSCSVRNTQFPCCVYSSVLISELPSRSLTLFHQTICHSLFELGLSEPIRDGRLGKIDHCLFELDTTVCLTFPVSNSGKFWQLSYSRDFK